MARPITHHGMTLLELLVVVAIVSILAVFAIPLYWTYTARAQAVEAVELLGGAKTAVSDYIMEKGRLPSNADFQQMGLTFSGTYTQNITSDGLNTLTATLKPVGSVVNSAIAGTSVKLVYTTTTKGWACMPGTIGPKYLSSACR
ncbi:MAG: pilin [Pseudomonadota bacterium]